MNIRAKTFKMGYSAIELRVYVPEQKLPAFYASVQAAVAELQTVVQPTPVSRDDITFRFNRAGLHLSFHWWARDKVSDCEPANSESSLMKWRMEHMQNRLLHAGWTASKTS